MQIKKAKNMHIKLVTQPILNSCRSYNRNKGKQKKVTHRIKDKNKNTNLRRFFEGPNDY